MGGAAPAFLDEASIRKLHSTLRHPSTREIRDRKKSLQYNHVAYRIELALRLREPALYERLMQAMAWADARIWRKLPSHKVVYPEMEYIIYGARDGTPGTIEPHVDNHSAVTFIAMLSDPQNFQGG